MQEVFVNPSGQDDNLGDSALRGGLLRALRTTPRRLHVFLDEQSSDYISGLPLTRDDVIYRSRADWTSSMKAVDRPALVVNAGEINPPAGLLYPHPARVAEMRIARERGGAVIAAGIGLKSPSIARTVTFDEEFRRSTLVSWRDQGSRDAVGFGDVAPDWAFSLGSTESEWGDPASRTEIVVTLRFDRPWPDEAWLRTVRDLAARTRTRIVTVAQVARDIPRAVHLADALGGEYSCAPSTSHREVDQHVRSIYGRSLVVVSDRAHALIMGATEGAYPLGSATDPNKIERILAAAGVARLTGHHDRLSERADQWESAISELPGAIRTARETIVGLTTRISAALNG